MPDRIGSLAAAAAGRRRLRFPPGAGAASWTDPELSLLDWVAIDAAEILVSAETLRRVSACRECRWVFLDTTRNHRRLRQPLPTATSLSPQTGPESRMTG